MKRSELIKLRELLTEEKNRRERIKELLKKKNVKEYLELLDIDPIELDIDNLEILKSIIKNYKVTNTNNIYVCTNAYYVDCNICYEDTDYYTQDVDIDSIYAEHRIYKDIESGDTVRASMNEDLFHKLLIDDFERNHIIINPTNSSKHLNNYNEVRIDFFDNVIKNGQAKSKKYLLEKYPKL